MHVSGCNGGNHSSKNNRLSKQQVADYIIACGGIQSAELSKYKREPAGPRPHGDGSLWRERGGFPRRWVAFGLLADVHGRE